MEKTSNYANSVTSESEREQVKALVREAIRYIYDNGKEAVFEEFSNRDGKFYQKPIYIFAIDYRGKMLAHIDPTVLGKNLLQDTSDKHLTNAVRVLINTANEGGGWVSYYWNNPETHVLSPKISYVVPINREYFIGAGYFTEVNVPAS
ncbi:MAG: cache domain-containing protein [Gammaproteobacteria bacterium]|nr:cache domain-containing protein [Gammaproteobacteria bacterium]